MNNVKIAIPFLMAILLIPGGMVFAQTTPGSDEFQNSETVNEDYEGSTSYTLYDLLFPNSESLIM